jgi:DNA polymerase III epsilon subunit family exonuclease
LIIFDSLKDFTVIDTETTGLSKYRRIVEFAAVKFRDGKKVDEIDLLINPETHIPESVSSINHIYDEMVSSKPTIREVSDEIYSFIEDDILVAHNAYFDVSGLNYRLHKGLCNKYIDTLDIFRESLSIAHYNLNYISKILQIKEEQTHRALDDVNMSIECLRRLKNPYSIKIYDGLKAEGSYKCSDLFVTKQECETLLDKHCVVTGSDEYISRLDIRQAIVNHGGTVGSSILVKTNYLVVCDQYPGPSKIATAKMKKRNGDDISIVPLKEFNERFCLGL